jgi:EAL domain-containing protein (putative c-di-GMP-specific phosphodiesterase class I)
MLARFGGDEFVVVLDDVREPGDLAAAGRRVLRALDAPFSLAGERVVVSASIGGVLGGRGGTTASAMLRDADAAMYAAKDRGGNDVVVFDDAASRRSLDRLGLRSDLLVALERDELWVAYQPIHDLRTGEVAGFEALLRWSHPQRGPVPPEVFVPLAEETGAIVPIGFWVLDQACRRLAEWRALVPGRRLQISVNLSALQLRRPAAAEALEVIRSAGVDPSDVWLELTENEHLPQEATSFITTLREAGVHFALDDFGMSHSNLSYLRRLPVERLKIDRSFVTGIAERDVDRGIVNAVLTIADSLGLDVVAEGIETPAQRQALAELNCPQGQGYLLSEPLPPEEVKQLLSQGLSQEPAQGPAGDGPGTEG